MYSETMFGLSRKEKYDVLELYEPMASEGDVSWWFAPDPTLSPAFIEYHTQSLASLASLTHNFLCPLSDGLLLEIHTPYPHKRLGGKGVSSDEQGPASLGI